MSMREFHDVVMRGGLDGARRFVSELSDEDFRELAKAFGASWASEAMHIWRAQDGSISLIIAIALFVIIVGVMLGLSR